MKALEVNPGFRVDQVLTMDVTLPWQNDPRAKADQKRFFSALIDGLAQVPGVRRVGAAGGLPMDGGRPDGLFALMAPGDKPVTLEGLQELFQQKERLGIADFCPRPKAISACSASLSSRGRLFDDHDGPDSPHVAVINQSLARERWPGQDPIARRSSSGTWTAICASSRSSASWPTPTTTGSRRHRGRPST